MTYLGSGDPARRRLLGAHFAGPPYGKLYAGPEPAPAPAGDSPVSR